MSDDRVSALERALSKLQAREAETQQKLDTVLQLLIEQRQQTPIPPLSVTSPTPWIRAPPPALPSEFDGDRSKGPAFLNSCQTYIRLCPDSFSDDQATITWSLSYMKSGRAAKWAARVFKYEEDEGNQRFLDWSDFRDEFRKEFCPAHSDAAAINKLETMSYFQGTRSVDEYLDEFLDLIAEAGYTDPKTLVVKFRRGLNPQVQNVVATMTAGRPSDTFPTAWYEAARNVDQNHASNEAFQSSFCSSTPARLVTKTPLSSKNRFDVLNIENIPSSKTEEDVPTSENSAPKRAVKMGAYFDNKNDALKRAVKMGAHFDNKNDALILQPQMGAYFDDKNDAPKMQSQMGAYFDNKNDAPKVQPQMGASFDDKSNALILPLQIHQEKPTWLWVAWA